MMRTLLLGGIVIALLPARAIAFPTGEQFDLDPLKEDGAGGIAFDGAPRFAGHTCAVCHTDAPGRIGLRLESDKPDLFIDGYKPSTQYHLRVVIEGAWAASKYTADGDKCGFNATPYHPCDENGFALEFADAKGIPVGKLMPVVANVCATTAPMDPAVRVLADGSAVTHNGAHMGITQWDLCWTSPSGGTGIVTAYLAAVDGNGGDGTENFPNNTEGDDVAAGTVPIPEFNFAPPPQTGGCDAGGDAGVGVIVGLALVLVLRGRRRLAVLAVAASLGGCVHVRPRQRGTLAHRNMKFAPDPAEDELDLHMQEAREGSSGGYGSSGGGCGCN